MEASTEYLVRGSGKRWTFPPRHAWTLAGLIAICGVRVVESGPSPSVWDSPGALLEWVDDAPPGAVEALMEGQRSFIRIRTPQPAELRSPGCADPWMLFGCPRLSHPRAHNAVRIVLRHNMSWDRLGGYWLHPGTDTARGSRVPIFDGVGVPGDGGWHDVILKLTDSPFLEPEEDVIFLSLRPFAPRGSILAAAPLAASEYLDIARIELLRLDEPTLHPRVSGVRPSKSRQGREVTIEGGEFAEPPARNVVLFGDAESWREAEVVGGDRTSLRVRVPVWQGDPGVMVVVRTPGGYQAVAPQQFIAFRESGSWNATYSGDGQRAVVGSDVSLSIRLDQAGHGPEGERVGFRLIWGEGALSSPETVTDRDGVATTTVTLGPGVGPLVVEPAGDFLKQDFVVTALPGDQPARLPASVFGEGAPLVAYTTFVEHALERALSDQVAAVRNAAAAALGRRAANWGQPLSDSARAALRQLLRDADVGVRVSTVVALGWGGSTGWDGLWKPLTELADGDPDATVRRAASIAATMQAPEAAPPVARPQVLAALRDPDSRLREAAAGALGRVAYRGVDVRVPLLAVRDDASAPVRRAVVSALGNTLPAAPETVLALLAARSDPHASVRAAVTRAADVLSHRCNNVVALGSSDKLKINSKINSRQLRELVAALTDDETNLRVMAATALGYAATAQPLLASLDDEDPRVRVAAADALDRVGRSALAAATAELAQAHPAGAPGSLPATLRTSDRRSPRYLLLAVTGGNPVERRAAAYLLRMADRRELEGALREMLEHGDPQVRRGACEAFWRILLVEPDFDSPTLLRSMWLASRDREAGTRRMAALALAAYTPATSSDPMVRNAVVFHPNGRVTFGSDPPVPPLETLADLIGALGDANPRARSEAARAIAKMGSYAYSAASALQEACASEAQEDVRVRRSICAAAKAVRSP